MKKKTTLRLLKRDEILATGVIKAMKIAISKAQEPAAVARKISSAATAQRNRGRDAARRRHPFKGVCEVSGRPLDKADAQLDEIEPNKGYAGKVRWVCPKANNSGRRSCGDC